MNTVRKNDVLATKSVPRSIYSDNTDVNASSDIEPHGELSAEEVFEVLARQNSGALLAFIRSLVRENAMVDDAYQETMMIAWRRLDSYDRERPFGPWLRGIAHKVVMSYFRKAGREYSMDTALLAVIEQKVSHLEDREIEHGSIGNTEINECVSLLPDGFRDAIELLYRSDRSISDAAHAADIGVEAMKKRVQRARALLADCLRKKGVLA